VDKPNGTTHNRADSPTKTCTTDGCDRALRARGLCSTHYNRQHGTRLTMTVPCDVCGTTITRDKRTAQKYPYNRCSELCRQWREFGPWSSKIPPFHMARWAGRHSTWKPPKIAHSYECEWCGGERDTKLDAQRFCSRSCKLRSGRANRKARERGAEGTYKRADIIHLWLAFDKQCAYCHTPTALPDIQAEHVHPLARGGRNDLSNLLPSCGPCNADKRDLPLLDWNADRARRNLPPVTTTWSHADNRYSHLATVTPLVTEPPLAA